MAKEYMILTKTITPVLRSHHRLQFSDTPMTLSDTPVTISILTSHIFIIGPRKNTTAPACASDRVVGKGKSFKTIFPTTFPVALSEYLHEDQKLTSLHPEYENAVKVFTKR